MSQDLKTSQASQASKDSHWMQHALQLAAKAEALGEVPVGAVVVKDGQIVGEGWNQPIVSHDPSAHAEIMALRDAAQRLQNYRLPGCELYITIEPCTMCAGAIVHARIGRVVFAAPEPKAGAVLSNGQVFDADHVNHRVEYLGGVCEAEASGQIQAFFQRRRAEAKAARQARKQESQ